MSARMPRPLHGLGLTSVEAGLEVAADVLAAREYRVVPDAPRRQLHDADVVVAVAVAARVRSGLIEGPKAVALPLSPHVAGPLPEGRWKRNPRRRGGAEFATKTSIRYDAAQRQLQGLQSRPETTK